MYICNSTFIQSLYCDRCKDGTYNFGASSVTGCITCPCNPAGTINGTGACDAETGECFCKENVEGQGCDRCKASTWGLNSTNPLGCETCDCDPSGTQTENFTICNQNTGQCSCLANRQGRKCDSCSQGFYLNPNGGCLVCNCHPTGTLPGTFCDQVTGQCECKSGEFGVAGKNCNQCQPTFYKFSARLGLCEPCNCLSAGSLNSTCDAISGQCECKDLVEGLPCDRCKPGSSQLEANNPFGCNT
ncbi:usherin-like, partial [Plakobranchus ocellatus]